MANFAEFYFALGDNSNSKGHQFEIAVKKWFSNDLEWKGFFREVFLWSEWHLAETRDLGVDLVGRDQTGNYWAIQAKAYDPESSLNKSDIDSFISASSTLQFAGRILVTTAKSLGGNLKATLAQQEKVTRVVNWYDLVESDFDWLASTPRQSLDRPLWKHQTKAINEVCQQLPKQRRGQLVMACGTGKTLTSIRIAERLNSSLTIVVVPSISLISQAIRDWSVASVGPFSWWAVCSDETVGEKGDSEKFLSFDLDKPSSTDPNLLVAFLPHPTPNHHFSVAVRA